MTFLVQLPWSLFSLDIVIFLRRKLKWRRCQKARREFPVGREECSTLNPDSWLSKWCCLRACICTFWCQPMFVVGLSRGSSNEALIDGGRTDMLDIRAQLLRSRTLYRKTNTVTILWYVQKDVRFGRQLSRFVQFMLVSLRHIHVGGFFNLSFMFSTSVTSDLNFGQCHSKYISKSPLELLCIKNPVVKRKQLKGKVQTIWCQSKHGIVLVRSCLVNVCRVLEVYIDPN